MATPNMATSKWKGLNDGVTGEWTIIAKIEPGQEEAVLKYFKARNMELERSGARKDIIIGVGTVHDYRTVVFDNGRYAMFMSNFDGDWGQYIDDFFATKVVEKTFDDFLSFCEGYPGASASPAVKKEWFQVHTVEAMQYSRAYRGTVKEMWKALQVQKAFQQVLDTPGAEKALANPVLKPLLDLAAK